MRLTKRRSLADSPTRNGGLPRLRANLQSERERSEAKKRFACDLLSPCSLATPFSVAKYPQVKWSSLSPRSRDHPLPPTSLIGVLGFFYSVAYFIVALHKIRHMKNNVHVFHFFGFLFFLRVPHDDIFNMTTKI